MDHYSFIIKNTGFSRTMVDAERGGLKTRAYVNVVWRPTFLRRGFRLSPEGRNDGDGREAGPNN
ncbi:MAG: hypothetical protein J4N87_06790, partial [Chloroflexi bacterium]|nr:hypothetical protein [Chloroflexota bacterium]